MCVCLFRPPLIFYSLAKYISSVQITFPTCYQIVGMCISFYHMTVCCMYPQKSTSPFRHPLIMSILFPSPLPLHTSLATSFLFLSPTNLTILSWLHSPVVGKQSHACIDILKKRQGLKRVACTWLLTDMGNCPHMWEPNQVICVWFCRFRFDTQQNNYESRLSIQQWLMVIVRVLCEAHCTSVHQAGNWDCRWVYIQDLFCRNSLEHNWICMVWVLGSIKVSVYGLANLIIYGHVRVSLNRALGLLVQMYLRMPYMV